MKPMRRVRAAGFSLIEVAVVLLVITILAGGVMFAVRVQLEQRQITETREALAEAQEALLAYAASNGRLPCAAQGPGPGDGQEQEANRPIGARCSAAALRGHLPWATLGIRGIDGWNRRLAYVVSAGLTAAPCSAGGTPPNCLSLDTEGTVTISGRDGAGNEIALTSGPAVAAALWSWGPTGHFGALPNGAIQAGAGLGGDEAINGQSNANTRVFAREATANGSAPGGAFDDQVAWVSRYTVFGRMMAAGQLP